MNEYDWVVANTKQDAISYYSKWLDEENWEEYDPDECEEIDIDKEEFFVDVYDHSMGKRNARWFLEKDNQRFDIEIPSIIFSTEY